MALQKGNSMGPVEAGLVHNYDDIRRKFFRPAPSKKHTESEYLAEIHELKSELSTSQKLICELNPFLFLSSPFFDLPFLPFGKT